MDAYFLIKELELCKETYRKIKDKIFFRKYNFLLTNGINGIRNLSTRKFLYILYVGIMGVIIQYVLCNGLLWGLFLWAPLGAFLLSYQVGEWEK